MPRPAEKRDVIAIALSTPQRRRKVVPPELDQLALLWLEGKVETGGMIRALDSIGFKVNGGAVYCYIAMSLREAHRRGVLREA
jgi:hypothetical protein